MKRDERLLLGCLTVPFLLIAVGGVGFGLWLRTRPHWQLSIENADERMLVRLYKEGLLEPIYTVRVKGVQIANALEKQMHNQLQSNEVVTEHYDDTIPPGAWEFVVNGVRVNAWEAGIVVNDSVQGNPGDVIDWPVETD